MGNEIGAAKIGVTEGDQKERRRTVIASAVAPKKSSNFTYYYPNWESYLDEAGNTYFFNQLTKETSWNPGGLYDMPYIEPLVEESNEDWDAPAPSLGSAGKSHSRSGLTDLYEKRARQIQERKEIMKEDPRAPWKELASLGHFDYEVMEDHFEEATDVVLQVSGGSFEPELLYKLPWAYKVQQLSAAVKDSYINVGDMLDSSKYDNCNDVPRYDNGGLLAWWMDLEEMHSLVDIVLESGVVGQETEAYSEEMKKLQEIAASGNEEELIEGFLARKISVEKELDGLRARCFAVVSLDSGPTREQLDNLYMYLKENVNNNTNLGDIQDEMEEVVSTWLEQKHRFMVDVVLMMGLLEDEHDSLQKRISTWSGGSFHPRNKDDNPLAVDSVDSGDEFEKEDGFEMSQDPYDYNEQQEAVAYGDETQHDQPMDELSTTNGFNSQYNGELSQTIAMEHATDGATTAATSGVGGIESQQPVVTTAVGTVDKAVLNLDKSIVASKLAEQAQEAKRLADELSFQKDQRTKSLQDRLAQKKLQRTQQILETEGVDLETAKLQAEVELFEELKQEEEEINRETIEILSSKDNEIKGKLDEIYQEEADRVSREGDVEREERIGELKERLVHEKELRVCEIINEMGCSLESAEMLCEEEFQNKELFEISKIEKDISEKTEKRRLLIVESLRNEHVKSTTLLDNELLYQKEQKIKSLKNRLEKRKEFRTHQLMGGGMAVHEAVAVANLEIKEIMTTEQKKVEDEINLKLNENKNKTISVLKEITDKESVRLEQDLSQQEQRQKKMLQEILIKREKKREEELINEGVDQNEAKKIAEEEQKQAEEECFIKLTQEIQEIKQTQEIQAQKLLEYQTSKKESQQKSLKERLAKKKAKKETELTNEEKLEQFLRQIREKQKITLDKLTQFIETEKNKLLAIAERQDAEEIGGGVGGGGGSGGGTGAGGTTSGVGHQQHVMQTMILIGIIKESLINGYKKQCVYQIRAIKEMMKFENLTVSEHQKAMSTASEQLIIQHCRDLKSLMDTQLSEQQRTRSKLDLDCAPMEKIIDMEEKYYKRNVDALRKQQNKLFLSLCGVYIQGDWLVIKSIKNNQIDEDEEELFGDEHHSNEILWEEKICQWFEGSLGLQTIYDKVPEALLSKFQVVMLQHNLQVQSGEASPNDTPILGAVLYQVTLVVLKAISESFQSQVSNYSTVSNFSSASANDIKPFLAQAIETAKANLSLEAALNTMEASQAIQQKFKLALQEFLNDPTTPTDEFHHILQSLKAKVAAASEAKQQQQQQQQQQSNQQSTAATTANKNNKSSSSSSSSGGAAAVASIPVIDENEERKNRLIKSIETRVERKRRDIQEKYRKRMEQKTHECKDAKTEIPEDFNTNEEKLKKEELNNLSLALDEVKDMIQHNVDSLQSVSVDGLMHALEKKLKGEEVETNDLKQLEIEATKENEKLEAKRLLKLQKDEAEKLDVMLKVQRAREQQALQKRLLARKTKVQK